ncbi:uncharacterized protein TNCV_354971 [Trichonephila clavipes]|uniref:DUF4817 domain-containing protein n=1 Tax=Trichonephila clavipes TaxID=2585209 RepID=A0A8X6W1G0_TRICX|nr:uncharacterized protein TNCV_354971 [Trichonephila clavipes]
MKEQLKQFCLLFAKTESAITVQRAFRIEFRYHPSNDNFLRWYHQFETTGCLCKVKYGTTTVVTGATYLDALQLWIFPQLEESEPNNIIWQQDGAQSHWHLSVRDW